MYTYSLGATGKRSLFKGGQEVPYVYADARRPGSLHLAAEVLKTVDTVWLQQWDGNPDTAQASVKDVVFQTLVLSTYSDISIDTLDALFQGLFESTSPIRTVVVCLEGPWSGSLNFPTCVLVPPTAAGVSVHVMTHTTQFELDAVVMEPGTVRCPLPLVQSSQNGIIVDCIENCLEEYHKHYPDVNRYVDIGDENHHRYRDGQTFSLGGVGDVCETVAEVDADRLLYGDYDYYFEFGERIARQCTNLAHLIVHVDSLGRDMTRLGALLNGIGKPMKSLILFFKHADFFDYSHLNPIEWDIQLVVDMGPCSTCAPLSAGWLCEEDLATWGKMGKVVCFSSPKEEEPEYLPKSPVPGWYE
jgi:hypothetical protein